MPLIYRSNSITAVWHQITQEGWYACKQRNKTGLFIFAFFKRSLIKLLHEKECRKILGLWVSLDLGVIAVKGYSTLPRSSGLEPHHRMQSSVIPRTSFIWMRGDLSPCGRFNQRILSPPPDWVVFDLSNCTIVSISQVRASLKPVVNRAVDSLFELDFQPSSRSQQVRLVSLSFSKSVSDKRQRGVCLNVFHSYLSLAYIRNTN